MNPEQLRNAVLFLIALILSICVHEFGHAFVADRLGDPLPRAQGRVTLNPFAHVDPIGTLLFPLIGYFMSSFGGVGLIGWGKPVRISLSARAITRKVSIKTAHLLIAIAGPTMNVLFAAVLSGVFLLLARFGNERLLTPVAQIIALNFTLAFFNLIPCPPLDFIADTLEKYGFALFFLLLFTGVISYFLRPAVFVTQWWLLHLTMWAS